MPDVSIATQREWLRAWLERSGEHDAAVSETHVSILAFTDDRVWKCKKAVLLPFIDLSTKAKRRANCEREVRLNRRIAPDVYLGVVPLDDAQGNGRDFLVEMRRLPDNRRLSALARHDAGASSVCIDALVDLLAEFHARAPTGTEIDLAATPDALSELWARNLGELEPFTGSVLNASVCQQVGVDARRYLAGRSPLLYERIANRRIRDGHGDLLADDVFCLTDGPRALDCLEFDDRLRYGDVLADVAFLAMDLERLGRRAMARQLLEGYRARTRDDWPDSLEDLYVASRALVRAKVACLRVADDPTASSQAQELLALAAKHLAAGRVRLVLIGGPPATGKTTLARELRRATGWPVVRSDEVRKELAGLPPTTSAASPPDRGLYAKSWTERTYAALLDRARELLERGSSVIVDASWGLDSQRSQAEQVAAATASEVTSFRCEVPPQIADARASARAQQGGDASDASGAIVAEMRARFEPWPDALVLDTADALDSIVPRVLAALGLPAIGA